MTDLVWDTNINDLVIAGGDFATTSQSSQQNGALILRKTAVSLSAAQFGVGFEEFYPLLPQNQFNAVAALAETQMIADGAQSASVDVYHDGSGNVEYDVEVRYRE